MRWITKRRFLLGPTFPNVAVEPARLMSDVNVMSSRTFFSPVVSPMLLVLVVVQQSLRLKLVHGLTLQSSIFYAI